MAVLTARSLWGVLDRLLEEPRLRIAGISGTSVGAMNAAGLAVGWIEGGAEGARTALEKFWQRVPRAAALVCCSARWTDDGNVTQESCGS
jgi:predicted acylesterase/phospholipase RssA